MDSMRRFLHAEHGYVATLTLIALPFLVGLCLLIIDMSRGNNLHTDLQNAVDGLALAGARELDGRAGAIADANDALADYVKNSARFSDGGEAIIDETQVSAIYLDEIPATDDDPIDQDWIDEHQTNIDADAAYLLVRSTPRQMTTLFPVPVGWDKDTITFQAEAVATMSTAVCDIVPMFICNPFESGGKSIEKAFADGDVYSKEFRLLKTDAAPGPGNFGLLDAPDNLSLRDAFAKGTAGRCYSSKSVTTKTGVTLGQVNVGINVRFNIYAGNFGSGQNAVNSNPDYRPAVNVRKGAKNPNQCNKAQTETDTTKAMGLPFSADVDFDSAKGVSKNTVWNRTGYWALNHPGRAFPTSELGSASRYDMYKYEISHGLLGDKAGNKNNGETGIPSTQPGCVATTVPLTEDPDRRTIAAAVVNCTADAGKISGKTALKPDAFVRMFLISPVEKENSQNSNVKDEDPGNEKPIHVEIVDVTGPAGNGTMDDFVRDESYLVR